MSDFAKSVNEFLAFRKFKILDDKGRISEKQADRKAISEYNEYNKHQNIISDFDKKLKKC